MRWSAVLVGEHVIAGVVSVLEEFVLAILELAPTAQRGDRGAVDRDGLISVARLAAGLVKRPATDHHAIVVHGDHPGVQLDIGPLEATHLAPPNPRSEFQQEQCREPVVADRGEESPDLFGLPNRSAGSWQ